MRFIFILFHFILNLNFFLLNFFLFSSHSSSLIFHTHTQRRYFFLFSDLLVWAEKGGVKKTYRYRGHFPMTSALVKEPDPPPKDKPSKDLIPSSQFALAFQLVQMQKQKVYTYLAKDEKEKREWMEVLEKVNSGKSACVSVR